MTLEHDRQPTKLQETLDELLKFPLMEALTGRRSRRFCMELAVRMQFNGLQASEILPVANISYNRIRIKGPNSDYSQLQ